MLHGPLIKEWGLGALALGALAMKVLSGRVMCKVVVCVFLNGSIYFLILDAELRILADLIDDSDDDLCNNEFTSLDTNQGNNSYLSDKNHDILDNKDKEKNIDEESSSNKENVSSMFLFEKGPLLEMLE